MSTISTDPKELSMRELIDALRMPENGSLQLSLNGRSIVVTPEDWTYILDAAIQKFVKETQ